MKCSLIPPALGVPQHVFWGLIDVPQGEFAEQLVPILCAGHNVWLESCVIEVREGT